MINNTNFAQTIKRLNELNPAKSNCMMQAMTSGYEAMLIDGSSVY